MKAPFILALLTVFAAPAAADSLALWTGADLPGTAELAPGVETAASSFPCANCHGWDGAGSGEGDVRAPDLGRSALTAKSYDSMRFAATLASGITPDGRKLARAMPRYTLPSNVAERIWDFTKPLETRRRLGISDTEIRLLLVYDPSNPTVSQIARLYSATLAKSAPVLWGRRLTLNLHTPDSATKNFDTTFAVVGPFTADAATLSDLTAAQVPLIHSFAAAPKMSVFVPLALTLQEELTALARLAVATGLSNVAVVGGTPEAQRFASVALQRVGLDVEGAPAQATLLLSVAGKVPETGILLLPEHVALGRPDLAERPGTLSTSRLPFLQGHSDSAAEYVETSIAIMIAALEAAGPDPTRRGFVNAAGLLRTNLLATAP